MKKTAAIITDSVKYLLTGAVCGTLLNTLIMKSPLPSLFPLYTENISPKLTSVDIIYGVLLYCIAAPVLEELIFRRVLYDLIYLKTGFLPAALTSSLVFAVYHMNMIQGIYAFIMAMIICLLYYRNHRLYVPICLHIGANLAVWLSASIIMSVK